MVRLNELLNGVDVLSRKPYDVPVQAICIDSRHVWPGAIFVAIPGFKQNGAEFISDAVNKGAAVIISNGIGKRDEPSIKTPFVRVWNPRKAVSRMAANLFQHPSKQLTVIGITGTNGKTTTALLLYSILKTYGINTGVIGTLGAMAQGMEANTSLTTPDSIELQRLLRLFVESGVTHVIMEVSSHALELNRVADVDFDIAIFTNLSQDHLDFHKSMDNYFRAKAKLFSLLHSDGVAILNFDDDRYDSLKPIISAKTFSYSTKGGADFGYQKWGMSISGITGIISLGKETVQINSPLIGIHNLENILSTVSAARAMGIPIDAIENGIARCDTVPGRVEKFKTNNGATVIIDYAHTPDAYEKLFSSLRSLLLKNRRLYVIFGCGGERDRDKRPLMAKVAETFADKIYVTPDNPRTESVDEINNDIVKGFSKNIHTIYSNRKEAIHDAMSKLEPNDILVVVGKGRVNYQIIGTEKIPHSDIDTVINALNEI